MILNEKQAALLSFVIASHGDQKRKYTNEPYWHHPMAVACLIAETIEEPGTLIEIALCHDLFEDTSVDYDQLRIRLESIGYDQIQRIAILRGVEALTDVYVNPEEGNRKQRKEWEAYRLAKINGDFQTVKYADLIDNTKTIVEHDKGFAKVYLAEKRRLVELMRNGNLAMLVKCYNSLIQAENDLCRVDA